MASRPGTGAGEAEVFPLEVKRVTAVPEDSSGEAPAFPRHPPDFPREARARPSEAPRPSGVAPEITPQAETPARVGAWLIVPLPPSVRAMHWAQRESAGTRVPPAAEELLLDERELAAGYRRAEMVAAGHGTG